MLGLNSLEDIGRRRLDDVENAERVEEDRGDAAPPVLDVRMGTVMADSSFGPDVDGVDATDLENPNHLDLAHMLTIVLGLA